MIKTVVFMGDSHTWGEGVGAEYGFDPPVVCAEKRMLPFGYPYYVNLIREWINARTGSSAREIITDELAALCGVSEGGFGLLSPDKAVGFRDTFGLCRIFFRAPKEAVQISILLDGRETARKVLRSDAADTSGNVVPVCFFAENGRPHNVSVTADRDGASIHRIELYSGEYAVINSGIGSCPVGAYLDRFFDDYISVFKPHAVVFEGNTINDWLSGETPEEYSVTLTKAVERLSSVAGGLLCHNVFPVAGAQRAGNSSADYDDFAEIQKSTLRSLGVRFADVRAEFEKELARVSEEKRGRFAYHDPWHPNGTGHFIYARTVLPELAKMLRIGY